MAEFTLRQKIMEAFEEAKNLQHHYLEMHGWEYTCNTPGSYWLWRRDFTKEDTIRHARWKERGPGPLGWPSEPQPFGVITADTDLAVSITENVLDDTVDQDGDPETPEIAAGDVHAEC